MGPLDLDRLFACLRGAISTDAGVRSSAEATLQSLEDQSGYCSCLAVRIHSHLLCCIYMKYKADPKTWLQGRSFTLCSSSSQEIISSKQADHSARWLATIQLKNTIMRHWRQRSDSRQGPRSIHLLCLLPC